MKRRITWSLLGTLALAISWGIAARVSADAPRNDSLQAEVRSLSLRIDEYINRRLREAGIQPAALTDDAHFYRRVSLDLIGKIPNLLDIRDFLDDPNPNKRWDWVERMLKDEGYSNHFADVLRATLVPTTNDNFQARALLPAFEEWCKQHLRKDTGYDKMVREILTAQPFFNGFNGMATNGGSPSAFYFANENKPENLAGTTARLFLGVKLECAQCHAHPFAKWTKNQFWEYAAFFGGIQPNQPGIRQPFNNNKNRGRQITVPGTGKVVKAKFINGKEPVWKDNVDSRATLANWVTGDDNPYFARAAVDMIWHHFFGISLLEPIIEPHEDNPISHPELLDELARQFAAHKYDLKFLIRAIIQTQAYQRSSEPFAGKDTPEDLLLFARMPVRGLSPEQIFDSIAEATDYKQPPPNPNARQQFFFNGPQTPRDEFLNKFTSRDKLNERETSILQALLMMNGGFLHKRTKLDLKMNSEKLAALSDLDRQNINVSLHTLALQQEKPAAGRLESLYMMVLSRPPRPDELQRMVRYVDSGGPAHDRRQAFADVYWALLNSGEFMLNH